MISFSRQAKLITSVCGLLVLISILMLQRRVQSACQLHTIKPDFYVFGFPFPLRASILNVRRKSTNKTERDLSPCLDFCLYI